MRRAGIPACLRYACACPTGVSRVSHRTPGGTAPSKTTGIARCWDPSAVLSRRNPITGGCRAAEQADELAPFHLIELHPIAEQVREVKDRAERDRLWSLAVAAYPPYAENQPRTARQIPVFVAEP